MARYIYNWALARCQQYDQQHGRSMPRGELSAELTQLKQAELWLYDFDSQMLQPVLADLGRASINFLPRQRNLWVIDTSRWRLRQLDQGWRRNC